MTAAAPGAFGSLVIFNSSGVTGGNPCARQRDGNTTMSNSTSTVEERKTRNLEKPGMKTLQAHLSFHVESGGPEGESKGRLGHGDRARGAPCTCYGRRDYKASCRLSR